MKTEKMFLCTIDEEDGELVTLRMAPADLCALLSLADELDENAELIIRAARNARLTGRGPTMEEAKHDAGEWRYIARRIREALGMEGGSR